jgi:hypothetical protein
LAGLLDKVNWIDLFALILLLRITYVSSIIGVGRQVLPAVFLALVLIITMYGHSVLSSFLTGAGIFTAPVSRFLSYMFVLGICFIIYRIASQVVGLGFSQHDEGKAGIIENVGGTLLGVLRSTLIIGIIMIGLGLMPVRMLEGSVKNSYSGAFFIRVSLRVYNSVINLVMRGDNRLHQRTVKEILSEKESYIFDSVGAKDESKGLKKK